MNMKEQMTCFNIKTLVDTYFSKTEKTQRHLHQNN